MSIEEKPVLPGAAPDGMSIASSSDPADSLNDEETATGTSGDDIDPSDIHLQTVKSKAQAIAGLRVTVLLVLLASAGILCYLVYKIASNSSNDEFETRFQGAANLMINAVLDMTKSKFAALSGLGVALTSQGLVETRSWPFVTLANFQERAKSAMGIAHAEFITLAPFVEEGDRNQWEAFTQNETENSWVQVAMDHQDRSEMLEFLDDYGVKPITVANIPSQIWIGKEGSRVVDQSSGPFFPSWQAHPVFEGGAGINENLMRSSTHDGMKEAFESGSITISRFFTGPTGGLESANPITSFSTLLYGAENGVIENYEGGPISHVFVPVFDSFEDERKPVAILNAWIDWGHYFEDILSASMPGMIIVVSDACEGVYSYQARDGKIEYLGAGDLHDTSFNIMRSSATLEEITEVADGTQKGTPFNSAHCQKQIDLYPSKEFDGSIDDKTARVITLAVALIFLFTFLLFLAYDRLVTKRQKAWMKEAMQSNAIVSSLFPENVRKRLMKDNERELRVSRSIGGKSLLLTGSTRSSEAGVPEQPIADLFPHCSVLFADISNFTAWSSARAPQEVFILLQTLYSAFDTLAKRRKVFKVETIGDSYLAATGLPEPQANHAVILVRFAAECLAKMKELTNELISSLGPDTSDLTLRIGIHSGPVTAGVLKGDRARFQLFGDTVNTAARMESTGIKDKIQVSQDTCDLLKEAGKDHWIQARAGPVNAKGKGTLNTFWVNPSAKRALSSSGSGTDTSEASNLALSFGLHCNIFNEKQERLVDWMTEMLSETIKKVVAMRKGKSSDYVPLFRPRPRTTCLDEVAECIQLPKFDPEAFAASQDYRNVCLEDNIKSELRDYVSIIASTYADNPFHNFEHACHVTMSTQKFLKRIVEPKIEQIMIEDEKNITEVASKIHSYTYGINSDPLTVLAILISALVHDADHRGVSNMQLGIESPKMAAFYTNRSIAEQNSLDISWDLLMSDQFANLHRCLFSSEADLNRFRQVLVNVVLATDIFDKEINAARKERWKKAFAEGVTIDEQVNDLRGTIVLEHIIQASDVSHTMQHWHVYRKWNHKLFTEMRQAFKAGRMSKDPAEFWYTGELGFFDNYVIPLAKKLESCNVFGVSSDECYIYACKNREEWKERGQSIVAQMMEEE